MLALADSQLHMKAQDQELDLKTDGLKKSVFDFNFLFVCYFDNDVKVLRTTRGKKCTELATPHLTRG